MPQFADRGVDEELYAHVHEWSTWTGYAERERLAVEYAERFALDHESIDADFFRRLRTVFTDDEIVDLGISVGSWLAYGRLTRVLGLDRACDVPV